MYSAKHDLQQIVDNHGQSKIDKALEERILRFGRIWQDVVLGDGVDQGEGTERGDDLLEYDEGVHSVLSARVKLCRIH